MTKKICNDCGVLKDLSEFYSDRTRVDGHRYNCKVCQGARGKKYSKENRPKVRSAQNKWVENNRARARGISTQYRSSNRGKAGQSAREYASRNKEKVRAHNALNQKIRSGKVKSMPCEKCGCKKAHAHHEDYSKPFDVIWLCSICHGRVHRIAAGGSR